MNALKMILVVMVVVILLSGCAILGATSGINNPPTANANQASGFGQAQAQRANGGTVPIVFVNPSSGVYRHVWLFEGRSRVEVIPDPQGGWMFNRPVMADFKIEPANSREWHQDAWYNLPRNSVFTVYEQAERIVFFDPIGQPYKTTFRTGSNPLATTYHKQSPTRPELQCGGIVHLPHRDPSSGTMHWRPQIELNPGAVLKRALLLGGGR